MNTQAGLEQCLSFISCQSQSTGKRRLAQESVQRRAVTLSRQTGAGGHAVAEKLAAYLDKHAPSGSCRWTIFDRNLVDEGPRGQSSAQAHGSVHAGGPDFRNGRHDG